MNTTDNKLCYTPSELASKLGVGKNSIYKFLGKGYIHTVKVGRKTLIPKITFDNWFYLNPTPRL
jgi:excisionase family DNA binding protein